MDWHTLRFLLFVALAGIIAGAAYAIDLSGGTMYAVPVKDGKAPTVDGDLRDWDLSAAEPMWISNETAAELHASLAYMYDDEALYIGAKVSLPHRALRNPNNPVDGFWWGDELEFRIAADPTLPWPLDGGNAAAKATMRVAHITIWKNTATRLDYMNLTYGTHLDKGNVVNPPGTQVALQEHEGYYVIEGKIPWSVLNVPGGKNPFTAGGRMTLVAGFHWGGETQVTGIYRINPGSFAFSQPQTWGQLEFSATGNLPARHATMEETLAAAAKQPTGMSFTIQLPKKGKVSVNILGLRGEVLRELIGGEEHDAGPLTLTWDGRDGWGNPLTPGAYHWGAYISPGLRAEYVGMAGTSGDPPYETENGRGGWGADHGPAVDVAADATGLYFLWLSAEAGRAIVKTDYAGNVLWRKNPFVEGGFGPLYAVAANGTSVFITFGKDRPELFHLDAASGQLLTYGKVATAPILGADDAPGVAPPAHFAGFEPSETSGLACTAREVYAALYTHNLIRVLDAATGAKVRDIACPGPRGLALDAHGDLYAVSYAADRAPAVLKFTGATGAGVTVVSGLDTPYDVTVDAAGVLYVSEQGARQQVTTFTPAGKPLHAIGKAGGRRTFGAYDQAGLRNPIGIAADAQDGLLVAEAAPPKVMTRFNTATRAVLKRWYGAIGYAGANFGDPRDPWTVYYPLEAENVPVRAHLAKPGTVAVPTAQWMMKDAGYQDVDSLYNYIAAPFIVDAVNKRRYFVSDTNPRGVCLLDGDKMLPVGRIMNVDDWKANTYRLEIWTDRNGDHHLQPDEVTIITTIEGKPVPAINDLTGSLWMNAHGDAFLVTHANKIICLPAKGFLANGAVVWDTAAIHYAVPTVLASMGQNLWSGWRAGVRGVRQDSKGNLYTCFNAEAPYATPALTKQMHEGLGHTSESTAVKIAKYAPDGSLSWMAGRKATAAAKPGEMYHFWVMGGLVGDNYVAGCSEWGQIYFYTADGFYVDALMNNPGLAPPAGPYTFGSETFGGRVQYYPARGEVWAYSCGLCYKVQGFTKNGLVADEQRLSGTVTLDKVYALAGEEEAAGPLRIVPLAHAGDAATDWSTVPQSKLSRNKAPLATAQFAYDAQNLYGRIHVVDASPLRNSADTVGMIFKGGDAVGIDLGPAGARETPALGDVRILAALIGGQPRLVAMKPHSARDKQPEHYFTPASGDVKFDFVGEIPGGTVRFVPDADGGGYTALFTVPRAFLEVTFQPGATLAAEVEVLLSGQGARGLQTIARNYLYTQTHPETSMTDDLPTESRLYPKYWGSAKVE